MATKKRAPAHTVRTRRNPLPKVPRHTPPPPPRKYPFPEMEVGDMFFVPGGHRTGTLTTYASLMSRKLQRKFATRKTWGIRQADGTYETVAHCCAGAVLGIGVWRTA